MNRKEKNNDKKKMNKKRMRKMTKVVIYVGIIAGVIGFYQYRLIQINNKYQDEISDLMVENDSIKRVNDTYAEMLKTTDATIAKYKQERDDAKAKYDYIQEQIKYSKINANNVTADSDLTKYPIMTINEMQEYINNTTPEDSPFREKAEVFLKSAEENNIDPRYLVSHACLESNYGKSYLAQTKGNLFGINAQNHDPNQAYHMGDSIDKGIENGAKWIAENYIHNGKNTLIKMAYGKYAVNDDGSPNIKWVNDITHIANRKLS